MKRRAFLLSAATVFVPMPKARPLENPFRETYLRLAEWSDGAKWVTVRGQQLLLVALRVGGPTAPDGPWVATDALHYNPAAAADMQHRLVDLLSGLG